MRILGLDYGDYNIGVAVSDDSLKIALGVETITRESEIAIKKTIRRLEEIIKEYDINKIVLGYPITMNSEESERCQKTILFKERLERNFKKVEIILCDERFTTKLATDVLKSSNYKKDYKTIVDTISAQLILQTYLDMICNKNNYNKN